MNWLAVIRLLLSLANTLAIHVRDRRLVAQGEANVLLAQLKGSIDAVDKAQKARDDALAKFDSSDGVPDETDPNLRD